MRKTGTALVSAVVGMSYYASSSGCSSSGLFDSDALGYTAGSLAIDGFGLLMSLSFAGVYLAVALARRHTQRAAPWWLFVPAVVFALIAWIISLIRDVLQDCEIIEPHTYTDLIVPNNVLFYGLTYLLWLAVLVFVLTPRILQMAGVPARAPSGIMGTLWALTVMFWISYTAVSNTVLLDFNWDYYSYSSDAGYSLRQASRGLNATFTVFFFLTTLVALGLLVFALTKLRSTTTKAFKVFLIITIIFWLASNILSMVEVFTWYISNLYNENVGQYISTGILDILFIFGAAYGMLFTAASRTFSEQAVPPPYRDGGAQAYQNNPVYAKHTPVEMGGNGQSTLYPYAPTSYGGAHEVHGQQARYEAPGHAVAVEAPGHVPQGLH